MGSIMRRMDLKGAKGGGAFEGKGWMIVMVFRRRNGVQGKGGGRENAFAFLGGI